MKTAFITAATALLSASALAAPSASKNCKVNSVYAIDGFGTRKYDGTNIDQLFFNIKATNGGTLDFECSPHDELTGESADGFESGRSYSCGENSFFYFRYTLGDEGEKDQLMLWQDITDTLTIAGTVVAPEPSICHAGPTSITDMVCQWPSKKTKKIAMKEL